MGSNKVAVINLPVIKALVCSQDADKRCKLQRGFMPTNIFLQQSPKALAFLALIAGNIAIAFGPLLVRYADSGPIATGFWRLALATPFLFLVGYRFGFRLKSVPMKTFVFILTAGVFFGIDIIAWHIGIFQTKLGNATLFANCASMLLVIYGVVVARKMPGIWQIASVVLAFVGAALLMGQSLELCRGHALSWRGPDIHGVSFNDDACSRNYRKLGRSGDGQYCCSGGLASGISLYRRTGGSIDLVAGAVTCLYFAVCWAGLLDLCPSAFQSTCHRASAAIATGLVRCCWLVGIWRSSDAA
jgi:drug/metabolite transporter (DMT)-like permease